MKFEPGWSAAAWCSKENEHKEMDVVLAQEIERIANARLKEILDASPVVYGDKVNGILWTAHQQPGLTDTHRARLVCIEEIGGMSVLTKLDELKRLRDASELNAKEKWYAIEERNKAEADSARLREALGDCKRAFEENWELSAVLEKIDAALEGK